jgi:hypothetical protein
MVDDQVNIEVEHIPEDVVLLIIVFLQLLVSQDVCDFLLSTKIFLLKKNFFKKNLIN